MSVLVRKNSKLGNKHMKPAAAKDLKNKNVKPLHLLLFSIAGIGLWLLAWNRVVHLRWAHQWKVMNYGGYAYQVGVILLLFLFGAACLSGPFVLLFRAMRAKKK